MWVIRIAALSCFASLVLTESVSDSDNEVHDGSFLRNFKSLHNDTDLQALASDQDEVKSDGQETSVSRSDTGPRVLRGTLADQEGAAVLDHPLFSPFKHNKIDTADFSDCALQGEWKPIGAPVGHYAHHEDHQKEHFHANIEGHEGFASIAVPNTHSPLDAEGLSVWNQLVASHQGGHQQRPHHPPPHHHHPKKHHKSHFRPPPPPKHKPLNLPPPPQHLAQHAPPPEPTLPHPVHDLDIFEHLRNPNGDSNVFTVQEKPGYVENAPLPQNLLLNQHNINDVEFALLQATQEGDSNPQPTNEENHHHGNDNFLSPPPMPQRPYTKPPPPPRIQTRPKYLPKRPPQHRYKAPPGLRAPPPAISHQHHSLHGHAEPQGQLEQTPAESSTFTCGHNHAHGTNYHTASYQVEGESDPSLLDDVAESNHLAAPIIVGQPTFDHGDNLFGHGFPHEQQQDPLDLAEEGTETGGSDEDVSEEVKQVSPFSDKKKYGKKSESTTINSSLETRAPQTFHGEAKPNKNHKTRPTKLFFPEKGRISNKPSSFEHGGFSEVKSEQPGSNERINERLNIQVGPGPEHSSREEQQPKGSIREEVVSSSQPNGFFSSSFGSSFQDFNFDQPQKNGNTKSSSFSSSPSSFQEFNFPSFNSPGGHKGNIAVFDHSPPHNSSKTHIQPKKKRPHKTYEVMENGGEMIPLSALFPPRKMPKQFDMRVPNLAVPKSKLPKPPPPPPPAPKYQSSVHFDGSNMGIYQSHPRNKVTKIRLKPKRNWGNSRHTEPDYRRSMTISSRIL